VRITRFKVLAGRNELLRAMRTCMSKNTPDDMKMSDSLFRKALFQMHGTLDRYIFEVEAEVPDRVHTHLRTHNLVNRLYSCSTSRPDLTDDSGKIRLISFYLPLKRFIEIYSTRFCFKSWHETSTFMWMLREEAMKIEPFLEDILVRKCIKSGYCSEGKNCLSYETIEDEHNFYTKLVDAIVND